MNKKHWFRLNLAGMEAQTQVKELA